MVKTEVVTRYYCCLISDQMSRYVYLSINHWNEQLYYIIEYNNITNSSKDQDMSAKYHK